MNYPGQRERDVYERAALEAFPPWFDKHNAGEGYSISRAWCAFDPLVGVDVAYQYRVLQQRIRQVCGRWVRKLSLCVLPLTAAKRLKLEDRLVPVPDAIDPAPRFIMRNLRA